MAKERWASRAIVNMLIEEKDYKAAAEVVSGCQAVFGSCKNAIQVAIASFDKEHSATNSAALQNALNEASDEIRQYREWEAVIKKNLQRADITSGAVLPLWKQFEEVSAASNFLDALVIGTSTKYFTAKE